MLRTVHIIADRSAKISEARTLLGREFTVTCAAIDCVAPCGDVEAILVSADLRVPDSISAIRHTLETATRARKRIFILDDRVRLLVLQAYALGATGVIFAPIVKAELRRLLADVASECRPHAGSGMRDVASAGAEQIASMFSTVLAGKSLDLVAGMMAGEQIAMSIANEGLSMWLETVREHHEGTFQHCLLVTGVAVDFGLSLGMTNSDIRRLYSAAMFHDIGKAAVPAAILDKPGRLEPEERAIIETHPVAGYNYLKGISGVSPEVLDAVRHHHEYLDGSGYPDGLAGSGIADIVRILTISDIFAALIEDRRYKPPMSRAQAFQIISGMSGKLEAPLVRAFKPIALSR